MDADATTRVLVSRAKRNRRSAARLNAPFLSEGLHPISEQELAELLTTGPRRIFLDASFLIGRAFSDAIWDAVLLHDIYITHWVWHELESWLKQPNRNQRMRDLLLRARENGADKVHFLPLPNGDDELDSVVRHYVRILGFRKSAHSILERTLREKLKREPTADETNRFVQRLVRPRGQVLAAKGRRALHSANLLSDEVTLVQAYLTAITSGVRTTLLTLDYDFFEQFYKLQYVINTHYRAYLIGAAYKRQPLNFPESTLPRHPLFSDAFSDGKLIHLPVQTDVLLLPTQDEGTLIESLICSSDKNLTLMVAGIEVGHDVRGLLKCKAKCNGKNSDALDGFNIHRCVHPTLQEELGEFAAIVEDRDAAEDGVTIVDAHLSLIPSERISRFDPVELPKQRVERKTIETAFEWSQRRTGKRLTFSPMDGFQKSSPALLGEAIRFLPPWCLVVCDSSLLTEAIPEPVVAALQERRIATTDEIRELCTKGPYPPESLASQLSTRPPERLITLRRGAFGRPFDISFDLYLALIAHKRLIGPVEESKLEKQHGGRPNPEAIRSHLLQFSRGRSLDRALIGIRDRDNPHLFVDDVLLVAALFEGMLRGGDILILTRSRTTTEQFVTLCAEVARHYHASHLLRNARSLPPSSVAMHKEMLGFQGSVNCAIYTQHQCYYHLPEDALDLQLQVWLLDDRQCTRFLPLAFLAERPMQALLLEQGLSGGALSTARPSSATLLWDNQRPQRGHLYFGESRLTDIGSSTLPSDPRLRLGISRIPSVSLFNSTNSGDPVRLPWHP